MDYKVLNMRCLLQNLQTVLKGCWTQTQRCLWGSNWCHGMQLPHEGSCRDGWKIRAAPFSCMCPGLAAQKEQLLVILTDLSNDFELFWVGLFCWSYCHVSVGHLNQFTLNARTSRTSVSFLDFQADSFIYWSPSPLFDSLCSISSPPPWSFCCLLPSVMWSWGGFQGFSLSSCQQHSGLS